MKIEHIALWAKDIDILRQFYETHFGAVAGERYRNERKGFQSYFLTFADGARLELMQRTDVNSGATSEQYGYAHIALSLGSEAAVDEMTEQFRQLGVPILDGPRWTGDGYYESVILDPEQNRIELTV